MVYLDYNASTPLDPRIESVVAKAVRDFGNASSVQHASGQRAAELVEEARSRVAEWLGRPSRDIIFASGASEAISIGILGAVLGGAPTRRDVVVSATEHKAVLSAAQIATRLGGGEMHLAPVDSAGRVDLSVLASLLNARTAIVAVMAANNETGVFGPIGPAKQLAEAAGAHFFCDLTQLAGKADVRPAAAIADLAVLSSHKIYGPKGAGALVVSRHIQRELLAIFPGGGQEYGLRGGTHDTAALVGFGLAAKLADRQAATDGARMRQLSNLLWTGLTNLIGETELHGEAAERLPNTLNLRFVDADAEAVMANMPAVEVSSGSACQSAVTMPSHVLSAMGVQPRAASESLRVSLGRPTTQDEIHLAAEHIASAVSRVRRLSRSEE